VDAARSQRRGTPRLYCNAVRRLRRATKPARTKYKYQSGIERSKKKQKYNDTIKSVLLRSELERLQELMHRVYSMVLRREIKGEKVPGDEKIYLIYKLHTDIIVKGSREVQPGHRVNPSTGRSNLILS
jgi:IS5 family transposase